MKVEIKNRWTGELKLGGEAESLKAFVQANSADLRDADLCDADLRDADLRDANLRNANLCDAKIKISQKEEFLRVLKIIIEE